LANKVGVSSNTIQSYEGRALPKGGHLISLSKALKCTTDYLLTGGTENKIQQIIGGDNNSNINKAY